MKSNELNLRDELKAEKVAANGDDAIDEKGRIVEDAIAKTLTIFIQQSHTQTRICEFGLLSI